MSGASPAANLTHLWAEVLLDELLRGGAGDAVVSPGMRSAPLAWACARLRERLPGFRIWTVPDERSAAFFALGLAKASGRPPILICTSGTAGAHYYPAVIEASVSRVPLLIVTADRPPELHGWGANQSIDQERLFGRYVDLFVSLSPAEATAIAFTHLRANAARAASRAGEGPVHLNVPLREPLAPVAQPGWEAVSAALDAELLRGKPEGAPWIALRPPRRVPSADALTLLRDRLRRAERPLFICGPRSPRRGAEAGHLDAWIGRLRAPLLAEAASNLRRPLPHYEAVLRDAGLAESLRPDLIIRLGGRLTTRVLQGFADGEAFTLQLHEGGDPIDPNHRAAAVVEGELSALVEGLSDVERTDGRYLERWRAANAAAARGFSALDRLDRPLCEPAIARAVAAALPSGAALAVGGSMPVRDLDAFSATRDEPLATFASRGVAGIDGGISTAFGLAAAGWKTALLLGDTAFLHDLNGLLWGARLGLSLTVVVVNNGGGRIFSFWESAGGSGRASLFDELLTMPLNFELEHAARLAGGRYVRPETVGALKAAVSGAMEAGGVWLIEARVDGARTVEDHRKLWREAAGG